MADQAKSRGNNFSKRSLNAGRLCKRDLRYRTLLYNLPEKVFHKAGIRLLSCNQNFAADFGMTPEQMSQDRLRPLPAGPGVGRQVPCRRPADYDLRARRRRSKKRYSHQPKRNLSFDLKVAVKDEQAHVTASGIFLGHQTPGSGPEAALRKSERTLRTLVDASPESIVLLDTEDCPGINELAARRLGRTLIDYRQRVYTFLPLRVAADRSKLVAEVARHRYTIRSRINDPGGILRTHAPQSSTTRERCCRPLRSSP